MDRYKLLQKSTTFSLISSVLAEDLLSGDFRSVFKGQGIEVDEVRHYEPGDDIRFIDWNVSARFGTLYVKMYREEREMTVSLIFDCSASMYCGSGELCRYDQGILTAALIAFSAERAGQRVGALFFDHEIVKIFPPRKGRAHIMAMISGALSIKRRKGKWFRIRPCRTGKALKTAESGGSYFRFFCINWEQQLGDLCRKHDVITIRIGDPLDTGMADAGLISMEDPETVLKYYVPTGFCLFPFRLV